MASQTERDTARAKSRQNGGDGGTAERMSEREAAAGLGSGGNNTTSGRGLAEPTFSQREAAAGLNFGGNNTTSGRDDFYSFASRAVQRDVEVDYGVYDVTPPINLGLSEEVALQTGASGSDGSDGSTPLYQDGAYTGPFAIKINGSYSSSEGVVSQNSSFNIGVEGGTGTWPTKTQTFSGASTSASAADEFYRVYGKITADRSTGSDVLDTWTDPSIQVAVATSGETVGSNTRYVNNGTNYTFFFLIGTVGVTVQPSGGYRIYVNQIQIGDYTYGDAQGVESDDNSNDTRDGVRSLTICINGTPYKADFELTNIREA